MGSRPESFETCRGERAMQRRVSYRILGASLTGLLMLAMSGLSGAQTTSPPRTGLVSDPIAADVQGPDTLDSVQAGTAVSAAVAATQAASCKRQLTANVVALDQVFFYNRLGA